MRNVKPGHTKPVICLDAGHYGKYNRSPVVPEYYESDMNWKLHLKLKAELEKYGIKVITTRAEQAKDMELEARGKASKDCDLFLSIHSNAADSESVDYPVAFVMLDGKGDVLGTNLALAIQLTMGTAQKGKISSRKGNRGEYYGVLRGAAAVGTVGMILEHSFHTNTKAAKWLLVDANLDKMAKVEAKLIAEYFDVAKTEESPKKVTTYTLTMPLLRKGASGSAVKAVQHLLMDNGIKMPRYGADGDFALNSICLFRIVRY